jgi:hypothetical protein
MINKYYLIKKLLTSPVATEELNSNNDEFSQLFNEDQNKTVMELYNERVNVVKWLFTDWVRDLQSLSGSDVISLFQQKDLILSKLLMTSYAETLINNGHSFKEVLEGLVETTLEHVEVYEKAEKLLTGKRVVTVMIDGNKHDIMKDGKRINIQTEIEDNIVTLEKCKEVTENIRRLGYEPKKLKFFLSIYTETSGNECGDFVEECLLNRTVNYNVATNTLMVWEDGRPILRNCDGFIDDNQDALADCYL